MMQKHSSIVLVIALSLARLLEAQDSVTDVKGLEDRVLEYRRENIKCGHVVLSCVNTKTNNSTEWQFDITFDGDRIRFDRRARGSIRDPWSQTGKFVATNSKCIFDSGDHTSVHIDIPEIGASTVYSNSIFSPKMVGMTLAGAAGMIHEGTDVLLSSGNRDESTAIEDRIGDISVWRIDSKLKNGAQRSVWIAPRQGYSIIRAEVTNQFPSGVGVLSLENEIGQYANGEIWFPRTSKREVRLNDVIHESELLTVQEAQFNIPVDEKAFTLSGFGLEAGRLISDRSVAPPITLVWNGNSAEPYKLRSSQLDAISPTETNSARYWILIVNALICIGLAGYVLRHALLRRRMMADR